LHDRVVKREAEERPSPGGVVIPDTASEKPRFGKVIAVGWGKVLESGQFGCAGSEKRKLEPTPS
jgi:chaperonin GroES